MQRLDRSTGALGWCDVGKTAGVSRPPRGEERDIDGLCRSRPRARSGELARSPLPLSPLPAAVLSDNLLPSPPDLLAQTSLLALVRKHPSCAPTDKLIARLPRRGLAHQKSNVPQPKFRYIEAHPLLSCSAFFCPVPQPRPCPPSTIFPSRARRPPRRLTMRTRTTRRRELWMRPR